MSDLNNPKCSFCSKTVEECEHLIAAPGVHICNECVLICNEILTEKNEGSWSWREKTEAEKGAVLKPKEWPNPLLKSDLSWKYPPNDALRFCIINSVDR
jgi:hypothetical protein